VARLWWTWRACFGRGSHEEEAVRGVLDLGCVSGARAAGVGSARRLLCDGADCQAVGE